MMTPENVENNDRRIQRCIDQELSARETRELLFQLDSVRDGWKILACGLLEDRNFRRAIAASADLQIASARSGRSAASGPQVYTDVSPTPLREIARRTWAHPLVSLTLCAAIAFVGGMLIPNGTSAKVPFSIAGRATPVISPSHSSGLKSYFVEMQPGQRPVEIPVVSDVADLHTLSPDHPLRNPSSQEKWIVAPVGRDSFMLIPASADPGFELQ